MNKALWGRLGDRYEDVQRPHKMPALDGGGIRGLITLGILQEIERLLRQQLGRGDAPLRFLLRRTWAGHSSTPAITQTSAKSACKRWAAATWLRTQGRSWMRLKVRMT